MVISLIPGLHGKVFESDEISRKKIYFILKWKTCVFGTNFGIFCNNFSCFEKFVKILVCEHKYIWLNFGILFELFFLVEITTLHDTILHECGHPRFMRTLKIPKLHLKPRWPKIYFMCGLFLLSMKIVPMFQALGYSVLHKPFGCHKFSLRKAYGKSVYEDQ